MSRRYKVYLLTVGHFNGDILLDINQFVFGLVIYVTLLAQSQ